MPKLNRFLVTSIIADIRECVCVTNEIYSWVGKIEHLSWKFPTKTAKDINAMEIVKEHKGTAGEFYILLLELAYDRIQFLLRLVVEFMDKYPFVEDFFKEVTHVQRPDQLSLASILRLVWNRLKTMPESISQYLVKNRDKEDQNARKISRSSQASSSMNYCASCAVAGAAILNVINRIERAFEKNKLISVAAAGREETKGDIYGRTQWAVMSRLADAIGADVETVFATMRENNLKAEAVSRDYEKRIRDLRADLSKSEKRMDTLQAKNARLEGTLENVNERLEEAKRVSFEVEEENVRLNETLENLREKFTLLAGGNNVLQSQVGMLAESKLELENIVSRLQKEVLENRDACLETERRYQIVLEETKKENNSTKLEYERKIEGFQREISSMRTTEDVIKIEDKVESIREIDRNKGLEQETVLLPEDDPEVDMTRQLISNREKIEVLLRQNDRLSKTLNRLQEYRLTVQTTRNGRNK